MRVVRGTAGIVGIAVVALTAGCASVPKPTTCAAIGAVVGGGGGTAYGTKHNRYHDGDEGAAYGAAGALVGAGTGYLLCRVLATDETAPPEPAPAPAPAPSVTPAPAPPPPAADPCAQVIRLRGVNFDFDKSEIRSDASVILDEGAALLQDALSQCPGRAVSVEGHTDWTGPDAYNQGLSERRASSVRDYLVSKGLAAGQLQAVGFGESKPVTSNETRDGRALNRRVDLRLTD